MKPLAIAFLILGVTATSLVAGDARRPTVPGTDDLIRHVAATATPGSQTTLRDASGRTLSTAATSGTQTTFRDSSGRTTGNASAEGSRTVFRDASGRTVWTATPAGTQTTTYRDASGRNLGRCRNLDHWVGRGLRVVLLQRLAHRPAARQQFARRLGEPAAQSPKSLESDLNLGTWVDEVVVVAAGAVGDGAEAHH